MVGWPEAEAQCRHRDLHTLSMCPVQTYTIHYLDLLEGGSSVDPQSNIWCK